MGIQRAKTVLRQEAEFLGMTFEQVLVFIERNPYAASNKSLMALGVYKNYA